MITRLPVIHSSAPAGQTVILGELVVSFMAAWIDLLGDRAKDMRLDERLALAAQGQAEFLARNDFQASDPHRGYLGSYANERVDATGYRLPDWWPLQANTVESAIRSWRTPAESAASLANHDTHRDHMYRQGWFAEHVMCGVGAAEAQIDRGGVFYVVVTAPREKWR